MSKSRPITKYDVLSNGYKEKIILEVEKRPALWDKSLKEHRDRNLISRLWGDVAKSILGNWNALAAEDKQEKVKFIQTQWKNIKDYFKKELDARHGKAGKKFASKRKYKYFDSLQFLIPVIEKDIIIENYVDKRKNKDKKDEKNLIMSSHHEKEDVNRKSDKDEESDGRTKFEKDSYEKIMLEILKQKNPGPEYDEEISFSQMIVPMLRNLNEDQKHYAKIEILNVLKNAKSYPFSQSPQISMTCTADDAMSVVSDNDMKST